MCQSVEATSGCTIADPRSVIVPRRSDKSLVEKNRLLNSAHQYSQLAEWAHKKQCHPEANYRRSSSIQVPSYKREDGRKKDPSSGYSDPVKQLTLGPSSTNNAFQVRDMTLMQLFPVVFLLLFRIFCIFLGEIIEQENFTENTNYYYISCQECNLLTL